ncbi:MAG: hypothetical protein GKS07_04125 [Nitrosopumilus sp.]|nr:MAG: hypothetical protein GKS07_04125 [Nitrosopumilus sp.]
MKALALFTIFVLIFGTASTSLVSDAYAQKIPDVLLSIATQADTEILNQLENSYGDSVPSDIQTLYETGHAAVESLKNPISDDVEQAQEYFLIAMKSFRQITSLISEPSSDVKSTISLDRDLNSELNRLHKYFQSLKAISEKHNTGIDFSEIEQLFTLAHEQINLDMIDEGTETLHQLESLIHMKNQKIREHSSNSASDRITVFALKQLEKIQKMLDDPSLDTSMPEFLIAISLVAEIETLISEDNIPTAKEKFGELNQIMKIIKISTAE